MEWNDKFVICLGNRGAFYREIMLSTGEIAKEMGCSQQTISRKLRELEDDGMIKRAAGTRGTSVRVTDKGIEEMKKLYAVLKKIFAGKPAALEGVVESGLGEGSYYVSLRQYFEQFKKKLGIEAFKGTLNVRVNYIELVQFITSLQKININGFTDMNRSFGPITAYKVKVNNIEAAIVIPERTSHARDVVEVISAVNFRQRFNLKDGDKVKISV
jgi:riboflavin kinase